METPPRCRDAVVLCAAEGGDRVIRLLADRPRFLAAVDRNRAQLHLLELKLAGLRALSFAEYEEFVGWRPSRRRDTLYRRVRWLLSREADDFWRARLRLLERGVVDSGRLERRLAAFRRFVRLAQGRKRLERFRSLDEAGRREAYARDWQTFLWRKFSGWLWRRWFDSPPEELARHLCEGRLLDPRPPLTLEAFAAAKEDAHRAVVVSEPPEQYLRTLPRASVDLALLGRMDGLEPELRRILRG